MKYIYQIVLFEVLLLFCLCTALASFYCQMGFSTKNTATMFSSNPLTSPTYSSIATAVVDCIQMLIWWKIQ